MRGEVGECHRARADERGDPSEQPDHHEHPDDQFDDTGPPVRPGAERHRPALGGRPPEQFGRSVQGEQEPDDDAEDPKDCRRVLIESR
jgi:hypothetical protein